MDNEKCQFCKLDFDSINIACRTIEKRNSCFHWRSWGIDKESINHPQHYGGDTPYEVIKVLSHWLSPEEYIGFLRGNYIKYLARFHMKGGLEDLRKANWYLNKHIEKLEEKK